MEFIHTSEETLTSFIGLSVLLCVSQTHPAVNLIEESRAEEGEVSGSDMGRLAQPEVPQELRDVQTLWQKTKIGDKNNTYAFGKYFYPKWFKGPVYEI